ncbi:MAG: cystathionine gamma-synthase [Gammaproteobacteria bacterium]|nr:MAG: cystathionine gamma-synthase [Gammaproteobacteria bacterium]
MKKENSLSMESIVAQACHYIDAATGGLSVPIQTSTTYARDENYELMGDYSYSRHHNPTYDIVEQVAATLDGGAEAKVFASGMAAVAAVFETVNTGEHIVAPNIMYHGAQDWLRRISARRGIGLTLFDAHDIDDLKHAIKPGITSLVWIESPVNPTWDVIDIGVVAEITHYHEATLVVDSTVAPPVTTRALDHGADIVFHSATKYLNGHSDVIAGLLVTRECNERWEDIKLVRNLMGGVLGPFEAWLLLRGMRTLFLRFERASQNALKIALQLENHPALEKVLYPGLESHPGHEVAKRQMVNGFGGMMSLLVKGDAEQAKKVATGTKLFVPATSLGGVESLIEHRASVEGPHSVVPKNLLRLSVGIENVDDLIADIEQSLDKI